VASRYFAKVRPAVSEISHKWMLDAPHRAFYTHLSDLCWLKMLASTKWVAFVYHRPDARRPTLLVTSQAHHARGSTCHCPQLGLRTRVLLFQRRSLSATWSNPHRPSSSLTPRISCFFSKQYISRCLPDCTQTERREDMCLLVTVVSVSTEHILVGVVMLVVNIITES
jgi:hypothetical protein